MHGCMVETSNYATRPPAMMPRNVVSDPADCSGTELWQKCNAQRTCQSVRTSRRGVASACRSRPPRWLAGVGPAICLPELFCDGTPLARLAEGFPSSPRCDNRRRSSCAEDVVDLPHPPAGLPSRSPSVPPSSRQSFSTPQRCEVERDRESSEALKHASSFACSSDRACSLQWD